MAAPVSIREAKWRALSAQVSAKLDATEAGTDFDATLALARRYRKRLTQHQRRIDATSDPATRDALLSVALGTFGVNGLWPAICDVEQQARFHGARSPAAYRRV